MKLSAFSDGKTGGNPAGVVLTDTLPEEHTMQATAAAVGFSETAFAAPVDGNEHWRVRYYSPESEVPFCGHATIALGAALAEKYGSARYRLTLNEAEIEVQGKQHSNNLSAILTSPPTHSEPLSKKQTDQTLSLFGYDSTQLDARIEPAKINAGASHTVFALNSREALAQMDYDLELGRRFMRTHGLVTIMFVYVENEAVFHARNAFASGGVLEDPATGAAAAAFMGYLRDLGWPSHNKITLIQGEDMGSKSVITVTASDNQGEPVQVSGLAHRLDD